MSGHQRDAAEKGTPLVTYHKLFQFNAVTALYTIAGNRVANVQSASIRKEPDTIERNIKMFRTDSEKLMDGKSWTGLQEDTVHMIREAVSVWSGLT